LTAIANTAAWHFPTIEQGGNSLYPQLAQRAADAEVLRVLLSMRTDGNDAPPDLARHIR
jgi:hypothetical protein